MQIALGQYACPFTPWRPGDGRVFDFVAFDAETTAIDDDRPYLTPTYVLGAACDGRRGVFITRESLPAFFEAHWGVPVIMHNAAFDLRVTDDQLKPGRDIYELVDRKLVWCTLVLKRLHSLATVGHTAQGESGLGDCAKTHLGVDLKKLQTDAGGRTVRTNFGQFLGKPPSSIPVEYLTYLAQDAMATWHLFGELRRLIREVLQNAHSVYGYVDEPWVKQAIATFGPLTHHVQLQASILMDALRRTGIGLDQARREEKSRKVQAAMDEAKERMRQRGYLAGQPGSDKALQSILTELRRKHPSLELHTTPTGKWSTTQEDLAPLAAEDGFFADYMTFKACEKLLSTYLRKMQKPRLHPKFGYLLHTGRTYCGGGFNLQNLPREQDEQNAAATIRGCFVPEPGHVFIDADYGQIELVVFGYVLEHQLGLHSKLARLINSSQDVHRLIAAAVLEKDPSDVSKSERNSAKAVSFGRPGGMGAERLQAIAKASYSIDLDLEEVERRIEAYHSLCPELTLFLEDEVDVGLVLAEELHLTPAEYYRAKGGGYYPVYPSNHVPVGWLGGMMLKALAEAQPVTQQGRGRPYTPQEIDFFWQNAQQLPCSLAPDLQSRLVNRQPDPRLAHAVRDWAGRRSVFTVTGRLRANATFCSSRNCLFQGAAADGALLGLWRVWRAGYRIVDFVHDQLVVESPADDRVLDRAVDIERLMKEGMLEVVPGMLVKVETVITQSLNKNDLDPRYSLEKKEPSRAEQPAAA
jgi:hypothetical protein